MLNIGSPLDVITSRGLLVQYILEKLWVRVIHRIYNYLCVLIRFINIFNSRNSEFCIK